MTKAPTLRRGEVVVMLQRVGATGDQIVEVDQTALAFLAFVVGVDRGDVARRAWGMAPGHRDRVIVVARADHARLGPLDLGSDLCREQTALATTSRDHRDYHPDLRFEQRGHGATLFDRAPP